MVERRGYDPNDYNIDDVYKRMGEVCPDIVESVVMHLDSSLEEYASFLWRDVNTCNSKISQNAREHFYNALKHELHHQLHFDLAEEALEEFIRKPVLQTGPHCQLLLDQCNLFSAIFSLMGIQRNDGKFYFLSNCATTSLESRLKVGPAWLSYYDSYVNVFGLSRNKRKSSSTFCLNDDLQFEMKLIPGEQNIELVKQFNEKYKEIINKNKYTSAIDAFNSANRSLWDYWDKDNEYIPVFIDESFYSKLMIRHLKDQESFIYKMFNNIEMLESILGSINDEANTLHGSMVPTQTDFFWFVSKDKIKPISLEGDFFVININDEKIYIENTIENLIKNLVDGLFVPNIFVIVTMISLLANARLVGGLHQVAYYPGFQRTLIKLLDNTNNDENILLNYLQSNFNHGWGNHVLEEPHEVIDLISSASDGFQIASLIDKYANMQLKECIRDLEPFRKYYRWGQILCN